MSVACSKDDGGISEPATVPVSSIKLNQTSVTLKPGESVGLTATVSPANATNNTVKWSSSNTSIATVTDGKVTAKANGTATIKAQCGNVKAECSITVKTTEVTSIKLNQTSAELYEDETIQLSATVIPEDTSESIIWKSSDETVATVSEGKVYARKAGKADITASIDSGANAKTATCSVTVKCHVEGVSLRDHALTVKQGQKLQLSATVYPDRASNKAVGWSSAEPYIASVSETGMLEAKSSGTVTISVTTVEGGFKDDCVVTVISDVAGITLNKTELDLRVKEMAQLTATVTPADATNKTVIWSSTNESVATVSNNGLVTAVAPGEAVICATTKDGGHKASCSVRIRSRVDEITLSEKEITLLTTDPKRTLTANVISADADFTLIWKSDNEAVATVKASGRTTCEVTPVGRGSTTIRVSTQDGFESNETVSVTVKQPYTGIALNKSQLSLNEGIAEQLTATPSPQTPDDFIVWSSDRPDIATVDNNGNVTALKAGTAIIMAASKLRPTVVKAPCTVTVTSLVVHVTGVSVSPTELTMYKGESKTVTARITPSNAENKNVSWRSSDASVATVNANGTVVARSIGTATITVTTEDGEYEDSCNVTVKDNPVNVTSITLDKSSLTLTFGDSETINATIRPENATNKNVVWETSDPTVAKVEGGVVTAMSKEGTVTITATSEDNPSKSATCTVRVVRRVVPVTGLTVSPTPLNIYLGQKRQLTATVLPADATDKSVVWSVQQGSGSATVDQNGVVTALKVGTARVLVKTNDGGYSKTVQVTIVNNDVVSIELNRTSATLYAGETVQLTATVSPENATNKNVTWSSSNTSVATVSNGKVTAKAVGSATITAQCGKVKAECRITVKATEVTSIKLNRTSATLYAGETVQLTATVLPENATNKKVNWTSSNTTVATVDNNGKVTAMSKEGTVTITAKSASNPSKSATCTVTVKNPVVKVTGVRVSPTKLALKTGENATITATIEPANATNKEITWSSTNTSVATVSNGKVTAVAPGEAVICATTEDGGYHANCTVTVTNPVIEVTGVSVSPTKLTLNTGESKIITATITPANATNKNVAWRSSNAGVATVNANGTVVARNVGYTTITVITEDGGHTASCGVTVKEKPVNVTSITLNKSSFTLSFGESETINATIKPDNATNKKIIWTSSDPTVAKVDNNGKVTAMSKEGTVTITATSEENPSLSATCTVKVTRPVIPVTSIALNKTSATLSAGETVQLTATISPDNATNKTVTWSSSNTSVATVTNGKVTAKAAGSATITARSNNGCSAICSITVVEDGDVPPGGSEETGEEEWK